MTLADRVVVMNAGAIEQVGTPLELYDRPQSLFVAGFIGSPAMNLLSGTIESENGELVFRSVGGTIWPLPADAGVVSGQPVTYGVRPEHFKLSGAGVPMVVHVVEPTGADTLVNARAGGEAITAYFRERVDLRPDQAVFVTTDRAQVHLFDAASGVRLN